MPMKSKYILLIIVFYIYGSQVCYGQTRPELLCRVVEEKSEIPISYATIRFANAKNGLIANIDGDFRIPLFYKTEKDSLKISSIGFETKTIALDGLSNKLINVIKLKSKVEELDEVVLKSSNKPKSKSNISAYTIVKTAISKIDDNYPITNYSKLGYYRDYQIIDNTYYNLNEAIIESFDAGFDTDIIMGEHNQNVLYSYRENNDFLRDSLLQLPYDGDKKYINNTILSGQGGNELGILNIHNPIRNYEQLSFSFVYIFKKKFLDNHEFTNLKKVYLNDEVLYEISFKANKKLTQASHSARGKIYISKIDFAIHKFMYRVYEAENPAPVFDVNIEYKKRDELMYLNYITFNNQFVLNSDFKFDVLNVDYNRYEKSFYIDFNNEIDSTTLDKRDFKFRFNRRKLLVKNVELKDSVSVKVTLADMNLPDVDKDTDMSQFTFKIKNIYDITNRKLFDTPKIKGFQYREFFVQEIFENKPSPINVVFIDKYKPLSEAKENNSKISKSYWLNSPLKASEN
jgi:hypothetical protein